MSIESDIKKLVKSAGESNYLERILKLCTPSQLDRYSRMYPNGATKQQEPRAIEQVEQTILNLNRDVQRLMDIEKEFKDYVETTAIQLSASKQVSKYM